MPSAAVVRLLRELDAGRVSPERYARQRWSGSWGATVFATVLVALVSLVSAALLQGTDKAS